MGEERPHSDPSTDGEGNKGIREGWRLRTRHIAYAALAIAIGHVIYAILRDHVFHASPILQ